MSSEVTEEKKVEEPQVEVEEDTKKKKKPNGKVLLIITIAIVCVLAATGGTVLGNMLINKSEPKEKSEPVENKYNKDEVSVPLDEFLVNLATNEEGETSYIRTEISLLTNNAKNAEIIETNKDLIRDSVINKLRQKEASAILADKNIANSNTPGYSRQRAEMQANTPYNYTGIGQIGTGSHVTSITRASDQFVLASIRKENSVYNQYMYKADVLNKMEVIFNETPGQNSLSDDLNAYFDAWGQLANNPDSNTAKTVVVESGNTLADDMNHICKELDALHNETVSILEKTVMDFNSKLEELNELNQQIFKASQDGGVPNDLLDRRDMILEDLSSFGNIDTTFDEYGRATVSIGGETVVKPGEPVKTISVVVGADENGNPIVSEGGDLTADNITLENEESYPVGQLLISNPKDNPPTFQPIEVESGAAKGLQEGLGEIDKRKQEFNDFAYNFVRSANVIHSDDGKGIPFFTYGDPKDPNFASTIQVNQDIKDNHSLVNAGQKVGEKDADGNYLPSDGPSGDGSRAQAMAKLSDTRIGSTDSQLVYNSDTMTIENQPGGSTPHDAYKDVVTKNGIAKQQADNKVTSQEFLLYQLEDRKYAVSGVNINEEITDVMRFQRAFQANARVISVVSDLLDTLINRTGV